MYELCFTYGTLSLTLVGAIIFGMFLFFYLDRKLRKQTEKKPLNVLSFITHPNKKYLVLKDSNNKLVYPDIRAWQKSTKPSKTHVSAMKKESAVPLSAWNAYVADGTRISIWNFIK